MKLTIDDVFTGQVNINRVSLHRYGPGAVQVIIDCASKYPPAPIIGLPVDNALPCELMFTAGEQTRDVNNVNAATVITLGGVPVNAHFAYDLGRYEARVTVLDPATAVEETEVTVDRSS